MTHLARVVLGRLCKGDNLKEEKESSFRVCLHCSIKHDKRSPRPTTHTPFSPSRPLANLLDRVFQQLHEHRRDAFKNSRRLDQLRQFG